VMSPNGFKFNRTPVVFLHHDARLHGQSKSVQATTDRPWTRGSASASPLWLKK
jgi:hypothetical protein